MNLSGLIQIEKKIDQLSKEEQLLLIERAVHRLRENKIKDESDINTQLAAMANDPEIQDELQKIENEFTHTEADGLDRL